MSQAEIRDRVKQLRDEAEDRLHLMRDDVEGRYRRVRDDVEDRVAGEPLLGHEVAVDVDAEQVLTIQELEKRYIERVLRAVDGNKARAARLLGLDRRTLYRKLERYREQ